MRPRAHGARARDSKLHAVAPHCPPAERAQNAPTRVEHRRILWGFVGCGVRGENVKTPQELVIPEGLSLSVYHVRAAL